MGGAAGLDPRRGELERALERRQRRRLEHEPRPGRAGHLEAVAEQAEAGHVRRAADPVSRRAPRPRPGSASASVDRRSQVRRLGPALAVPGHEQPGPQPLGQEERVAGPRPALAEQPIRMGRADDRQPVLRLGVADRVAAGERAAGLADLGDAPSKISAIVSRGSSSGNAAIDSANRTRPPIANTSLSAFAAAISPNVRGSSTSGGKKSSVPMIARSSLTR